MTLLTFALQALGLFFAFTLKAITADTRAGYDSDEEFAPRSTVRQPLLNRQNNQAAPPGAPGTPGAPSEARAARNDAWSARMRDKVLPPSMHASELKGILTSVNM